MNVVGKAKELFNPGKREAEQEQYVTPRLVKPSSLDMVVCNPKSFAEVRGYADLLLNNSVIIICLEGLDQETRMRIFDYMNGVMYVAQASANIINDDMLLYAPGNVDVNNFEAAKGSGVSSIFSR